RLLQEVLLSGGNFNCLRATDWSLLPFWRNLCRFIRLIRNSRELSGKANATERTQHKGQSEIEQTPEKKTGIVIDVAGIVKTDASIHDTPCLLQPPEPRRISALHQVILKSAQCWGIPVVKEIHCKQKHR